LASWQHYWSSSLLFSSTAAFDTPWPTLLLLLLLLLLFGPTLWACATC
jgi:hypothetical protein